MSEAKLEATKRSIGNMNGPWALGLKIMLATYPILFAALVGWSSWVTKELIVLGEFRNSGDRFTKVDAANMRREIDSQLASLPPKDWRDKYFKMEQKLDENQTMLVRLNTMLDLIKNDLDQLKKVRLKP